MLRLLVVVLLLIGTVFVGGGLLLSTKERAVPTVLAGFHETTLSVSNRDAPLSVFVWYPAEADRQPELIAQNALFYGFYGRRDAPGNATPAPVVLLSHGSGGNAAALGWLASDLAARGLIVIGTNHPGTTSRDSTPEATVRVWERAEDLSALLDFAAAGMPLGITPDMSRVAAVGFSLGGFGVLGLAGAEVSKDNFISYCETYPDKLDCGWMNAGGLDFAAIDAARYERSNRDGRVTAVVAVDPALPLALKDRGLSDLTVPALVVQLGDTDTIAPGMRWDAVVAAAPMTTLAVLPDTYHFAFLAECSMLGKIVIGLSGDDNICADHGTRDRGEVHAELRDVIGDFLDDKFGLRDR